MLRGFCFGQIKAVSGDVCSADEPESIRISSLKIENL
jgi:hypothetical protein